MADDSMTLQAVAEALGVHYMTAYRYVRLGQLPARKEGTTWRVEPVDLDEFRRHARTARAAPCPTATDVGPVDRPGRRHADWAERYEARLLAGDRTGAWAMLEAALVAGNEVTSVYVDVMMPALHRIGERWAEGSVSVACEHRASVVAREHLSRLSPRFSRRGRNRGTVILTTPPGEQHTLGPSMVADLLRGAGFEVSDLGADLPVASLVEAVLEADRLVAVAIGVTNPAQLEAARAAVAAVREAAPTVPVLLGGQAVTGLAHARALGADRFAADARDAVAEIEAETVRD